MAELRQLLAGFDPDAGLSLPDDWCQGRTAYGGLTAATALLAALRVLPAGQGTLRSAQLAFVGPADGRLRYSASTLRSGKSVSSIGVDVAGDSGMAARALFVFGQERSSTIAHDFSPPPPASSHDRYPMVDLAAMPFAPAFIRHFQLRPAAGAMPLSGADTPEMVMWLAHADAAGVDPAVALLAVADALPPAAFTAYTRAAPISTITWSLDLLGPLQPTQWYLLRSASVHAADGYSVQSMQVWDECGRLLLRGRQCVAVFA